MITEQFVTTSVTPLDNLDTLSPYEVAKLHDASQGGLYKLFRQCSLAVLNCGSELDSTKKVLGEISEIRYQDQPETPRCAAGSDQCTRQCLC